MMTAVPAEGPGARLRALAKGGSVALPYPLADRLYPGWKGPEPLSAVDMALRVVLANRAILLFEEDATSITRSSVRRRTILSHSAERRRSRSEPTPDVTRLT